MMWIYILDIQPRDFVVCADEAKKRRQNPELRPHEVEPRLIHDGFHLAEQHVDTALALLDDRVDPQELREPECHRYQDEAPEKREEGRR